MNHLEKAKISLLHLRSEDPRLRLQALCQIPLLLEISNQNFVLSELVPFLAQFEDDEEEIMLQLTVSLLSIGTYIAEKRGELEKVIPSFELILSYEDFSVIDKGIKSLEELLRNSSIRKDAVFDLALALEKKENVTSKISAVRICCRLHGHFPEKRFPEVLEMIGRFVKSREVSLRRETARELANLIPEMSVMKQEGFGMLSELFKDPQDSVKVAAVETLCAHTNPKGHFNSFLWPLLEPELNSSSWRVRYTIACKLSLIFSSIFAKNRHTITKTIQNFLTDPEIEVSIKTIESLKDSADKFDAEEVLESIFPSVKILLEHENFEIRAALAKTVPYFAPIMGTSDFPRFAQIIECLLKDPKPEVRMLVLANIDPFVKSFSASQLLALISPVLGQLLNDKSWTIRNDSLVSFEVLTQKLGESFASDQRILDTFKEKLTDRVYEIRQNSIILLASLAKFFGQEYAETKIFPIFTPFAKHQNYLYRTNYLKGIVAISLIVSYQMIENEIPKIMELCKDPVPNVRSQALICLLVLLKAKGNKYIEDCLLSTAKELENDSDSEIKKLVLLISTEKSEEILTKISELSLLK